MNIILFYQHIGRELYSIKKLSNILTSRKHNVYVFSIDFEFDIAIKIAKKHKVDIIVSPWMYHDTNYQEFVPFIKYNPKVKIINLHSEQVYSPFSRVVLLPAKGAASDFVYHFCWGENFKNELNNIGVPNNLIFITGCMRNDEAFGTSFTKKTLAQKYQLDENKEWILFAENRNYIKNTKMLNVEFIKKGVLEQDLRDRFEITKKSLKETIDDINTLPDDFFEKYELIYRSHPGFQGDMGIRNSNIREISDLSIYEWLNVSAVCVVWNSTTAFESDMMNVPVLVYSKVEIPEKIKTIGLSNYLHIKSLLDINSIDFRKVLDEQKKKKNYVFYYGEIDGKASSNVADAIETVANNNDGYKAKAIPTDTLHNIRWKISIKLTRMMIKLNLFEKLKFPRSSYQHKKDIPYIKDNMGDIK